VGRSTKELGEKVPDGFDGEEREDRLGGRTTSNLGLPDGGECNKEMGPLLDFALRGDTLPCPVKTAEGFVRGVGGAFAERDFVVEGGGVGNMVELLLLITDGPLFFAGVAGSEVVAFRFFV